jgi:hypothetical protein
MAEAWEALKEREGDPGESRISLRLSFCPPRRNRKEFARQKYLPEGVVRYLPGASQGAVLASQRRARTSLSVA